MDFLLFILVNATLFIRPAEIIPAMAAWPIYNVIIVVNLFAAGPAIINHLSSNNLVRSPITVCVLGVLIFVVLSHLAHFDLWSARHGGWEFAKVVAYFLLLVSVVNSPRRYFTLLFFVVLFTLALNGLAVLQYHGRIDIPSLSVLMQNDVDELTGEAIQFPRMRATGIFNDPNDLSMIIVASMLLCAAGLCYKRLGISRLALTAPLGFLFYCLTLTQSRGGLLALLAGCGVLAYCKLGTLRTGLIACAGVPMLLLGFGGRQADLTGAMSGGTGETRVELWSDGLQLFKSSPLFGIGHQFFADEVGAVAHNSFLHTFTELGLFGGMMFLGVIAVGCRSLWSLRAVSREIDNPGLRHLHAFILALNIAYAVSLLSLSRSYVVPTYLVAGIAASYDMLVRPRTSLPPLQFNGKLLQWLFVLSVGFIAFVYLYIKFLHRLG